MGKKMDMGKVPVAEKVGKETKVVEITYVNQNAYCPQTPPVVDKSVDNVENCGLFAPIFPVLPGQNRVKAVYKDLHNRKKYLPFSRYVASFFQKIFGVFCGKKLEFPEKGAVCSRVGRKKAAEFL